MTEYICMECGKAVELDLETTKKVQCPLCGYRILRKQRVATVKKVVAE